MSIVVTGATGALGRLVVEELLTRVPADRIAAVVRDAAKAADLAERGVELRVADYDDPASLARAFRAGDRVLLVSGNEIGRRIAQHTAVLKAARAAGVAQLAYTGILGGPEADFELAAEHRATEQAILDSGIPYTFLRNGWYHENYTRDLTSHLERGALVGSAGEGRVASAARADYAAAAAVVLTGEGHLNRAYELSGDASWSLAEYAAELSAQSGREVAYTELTPEAHRAVLTAAGLPEGFAAVFADVDAAIRRGRLGSTDGDLARLIGRPTTPVSGAIADALAAARR
ncbi:MULTISPECIES: SDR family oxidoreductase [unclassified Streptomyces]|uniref:SDR family oxidoreductase n=1 Tax=unclassified Streptomyces TaxID=2593676 RepID=UPI000DC7800C|nr:MULTISPECIES: SDR family oxidoreductase [unclassified Streptomyces]AWZ07504.1 NAD(P)-dependent oxidoreductase [Streptomyces sp. ICC4]AWZ15502.1 NAD(P)-dependent oxidoreductase [Streptomyces sp. ICC1]